MRAISSLCTSLPYFFENKIQHQCPIFRDDIPLGGVVGLAKQSQFASKNHYARRIPAKSWSDQGSRLVQDFVMDAGCYEPWQARCKITEEY